jgi:hypothetical protein
MADEILLQERRRQGDAGRSGLGETVACPSWQADVTNAGISSTFCRFSDTVTGDRGPAIKQPRLSRARRETTG